MNTALRERLIALLDDLQLDGGCLSCGMARHKPGCELHACLQELRQLGPEAPQSCPSCGMYVQERHIVGCPALT